MSKDNSRPAWDDIWMKVAHAISERSIDPRYKVGAVIVSDDNTQVLDRIVESLEPGQSGCIHAEINALIKLDYNNPKKKKMYVTLSPCKMCAKALINGNIDEIVFDDEYRNTEGLDLLSNSRKKVRQFSPTK